MSSKESKTFRPASAKELRNKKRITRTRMCMMSILATIVCATILLFIFSPDAVESAQPKVYAYKVLNEYEHDPRAFCQGLVYAGNDTFYESVGLFGQSDIREVDVLTGTVRRREMIPSQDFGEGLALSKGNLVQLTWKQGKGHVWDAETFQHLRTFDTGLKDGWGLTNENPGHGELILTDSGSKLYFLDADTMQIKRSVQVRDGDMEVTWLNELEWINGEVWANTWMTDCIARINPASGQVTGWVVLDSLTKNLKSQRIPQPTRMDVLNCIAYDTKENRIFVTGKQWPRLYHIKPIERKHVADYELEIIRRKCIPRQHRG